MRFFVNYAFNMLKYGQKECGIGMSFTAQKVWIDGRLLNWNEANIHVTTHALHYGTAVFEGIRAYKTAKGTAVFRLKDHIKRLYESAKIYMMDVPYSASELTEAINQVIVSNNFQECYIRPIVFRGYGSLGVNPFKNPVTVAVIAWEWGSYLGEGDGVRCMVSTWRRINSQSLPPQAKCSANYANSALAKMEAVKNGYDEAIMLNTEGYVTEGTGENVFRVKEGMISTPPASSGALRGVTRNTVMTLAEELKIRVDRVNLSREELYTADELFFTGTAAEIVSITEIDGRRIGNGKYLVTQRLKEAYRKLVHGETAGHEDWLVYVSS